MGDRSGADASTLNRPLTIPLSDSSGVCCLASEGQLPLRVSSIRFGFGIGV